MMFSKEDRRNIKVWTVNLAVWSLSITAPTTAAHGHGCSASSDVKDLADRCASAAQIIDQSEYYCRKVRRVLTQIAGTTQQAQTLTGAAKKFQANSLPPLRRLTGAQLARARAMYKSDLQQFAAHVKEYCEHTTQVRNELGACESSRKAYEKTKGDYSLHCKEFHMSDIPPPHICIEMGTSVEEAAELTGRLAADMRRMVEAEMALQQAEARLNKAVSSRADIDAKVRNQHEINLKEQALAEEFARLSEEFKQLEIERKTINAHNARTAISSVQAKVRKRH